MVKTYGGIVNTFLHSLSLNYYSQKLGCNDFINRDSNFLVLYRLHRKSFRHLLQSVVPDTHYMQYCMLECDEKCSHKDAKAILPK